MGIARAVQGAQGWGVHSSGSAGAGPTLAFPTLGWAAGAAPATTQPRQVSQAGLGQSLTLPSWE